MKAYYFGSVAMSLLGIALFVIMFLPTLGSSSGANVYSLAGYFSVALILLVLLLLNSAVASVTFWRYGFRRYGIEAFAGTATLAHLILVVGSVFLVADAIMSRPSPAAYEQLSKAASEQNKKSVAMLLDQGHVSKELRKKIVVSDVKDLSMLDLFLEDDKSLLHPLFCYSVYSGESSFVEHYVKRGADIEQVCDEFGVKPIFLVQNGRVLQILLKAGVDLMARNAGGDTAFAQLIYVANLEEELSESDLVAAANSNPKLALVVEAGTHPLMLSVRNEFLELAQTLIKLGADVNYISSSGETALFLARSAQSVRFLKKHGANLDHRNAGGKTPLLYFVSKGEVEPALEIVNVGANPNIRDNDGFTVVDYIKKMGDTNSEAALRLRGLLGKNSTDS
ncbi:MAG: ankyrin repeat domain-containing protein [Gammaproteobacteria bacterium]|nr:ankyrin repeat domain-containing protein [Gammaproteobacteria bacterium]MDH5800038.1 ankyrin repeat domain-containing protein [Gammaproteobacteria bacterium]